MKKIIPILLAGGGGTRLWPLSRKSYPKQFSNFIGTNTLFQQSGLRFVSSDQITFSKHITVTHSDYRFIVSDQFQKVGIDPGPILIEPESKNTAPAILAATLYAQAKQKDAVLIVSPSDHVIPDLSAFHTVVSQGLNEVLNGKIVTFGICPTSPETGYGYLSTSKNSTNLAMVVDKFIEKPNVTNAESMIKDGKYLWNAGIFLFKATDMIDAFKKFAPDILKLVKRAIDKSEIDLGFLRINPEYWSELRDISIDYAIMEKAKNLVVIPFSSKWSDLGGWDAVWSESHKDLSGNGISLGAHAIKCVDTLLRSESPSQEIIGLGLKNIVAIAMPDAVLVAHKDKAQDVKKVVDFLKTKNITQAEIFPKDHRPWGWFEKLLIGDCFQVKRIFVRSGGSISLQSHNFRAEHWIVVEGTVKVTIGHQVKMITTGQSIYVPKGTVHRMENLTKEPVVVIEVQIGSYLGEDDIVRYEDMYKRK